ncbi:hypothetical protein EYV94_12690 [Puteibacter caeruleilacunae]|nr:hypothetical protein EYV94_12690 [Puteibacter caeruleilacunae]
MKAYIRKFLIAFFFGVFTVLAITSYAKEIRRMVAQEVVVEYALEEYEMETETEIEGWMFDDFIWGERSALMMALVEEPEEGLEIEDWMTDAASWLPSFLTFEEEEDEETDIEEWMTCASLWSL